MATLEFTLFFQFYNWLVGGGCIYNTFAPTSQIPSNRLGLHPRTIKAKDVSCIVNKIMENELKALRTWSSMLSEAQHTAAIYQLIQETTLAEVRFLLQALKLRETELGHWRTMSGDLHRGIKTIQECNIHTSVNCYQVLLLTYHLHSNMSRYPLVPPDLVRFPRTEHHSYHSTEMAALCPV